MSDPRQGPDQSPEDLPVGSSLGKYRIVEKLGVGGRGVVYRANDTELKRDIALKILTEPTLGEAAISEHLAEARAAAAVNHANIVTIYDAGVIDHKPFIAMELVTGCRLDRLISNGRLESDRVLEITRQLLQGLQATHEAGIIHHDIKPSNIIIDNNDRVHLLDFGIASNKTVVTEDTDLVTGTLAYMAPEQIGGGPLTPAADLYSVGILIFEMLTGDLPFKAEYEAALIYSIINQPAWEIKELLPEIPEKLNQLVSQLLSKKPKDRLQTAEELLATLNQIFQQESGLVSSVSSLSMRNQIVLAILFVLITSTALIVFFQSKSDAPLESDLPPRLAVLPFENRGETEDDYFINGVTEAIAVQLSRLDGLRVIDRSSVVKAKTRPFNIDSIGQELGAEYLLSGRVYLNRSDQNNQVRVDAVLIRVGDDTNFWAESYVHELADLFTLQTKIARQVSNALSVRVTNRAFAGRIPTNNINAYDLFLKGNDYFYRSWGQEDLSNAVLLYGQAVELDSEFALAHAMLSRSHESVYWEYIDRSPARCSLALASAVRALEIDPNLPEAKLAMAYIYYHCDRNFERALEEFQAVLADWPNNSNLHSALGAVLRRFPGQLEQANHHFKTSAELDPSSHLKAFDVGLTYAMGKQYDSALVYLNRSLMLEPGWELSYIFSAWAHLFQNGDIEQARSVMEQAIGHADPNKSRYYWWLARMITTDYAKVLTQTGPKNDTAGYYLHRAQMYWLLNNRTEENRSSDSAIVILERQVAATPDDPRYLSNLGLAYARTGNREFALSYADKATELLPASRDAFDGLFVLFEKAETYMLLGMNSEAIEVLRYMLSIQGFITVPYLQVDPLWKPLSKDPSFIELLQSTDSLGT